MGADGPSRTAVRSAIRAPDHGWPLAHGCGDCGRPPLQGLCAPSAHRPPLPARDHHLRRYRHPQGHRLLRLDRGEPIRHLERPARNGFAPGLRGPCNPLFRQRRLPRRAASRRHGPHRHHDDVLRGLPGPGARRHRAPQLIGLGAAREAAGYLRRGRRRSGARQEGHETGRLNRPGPTLVGRIRGRLPAGDRRLQRPPAQLSRRQDAQRSLAGCGERGLAPDPAGRRRPARPAPRRRAHRAARRGAAAVGPLLPRRPLPVAPAHGPGPHPAH